MVLKARRPQRMEEISTWLRRGEISPADALQLAVELRRRRGSGEPEAAPAEAEQDRQRRIGAIMGELDGLVGLDGVKQHVREIRAYTEIQVKRARHGLLSEPTGLHMIFTGNPGTGKTTVARLLGRLFREIGLLPKGHLVEVERADLVGEYIGHTAQRTREVVRRAVGGVLFIDEAYSLARGGEKDFGKESIDCLVRAMEEHRGELMLILAGYPEEMAWFLEQNPGLRSRFPIRIAFPDYTVDELLAIAEKMWREREYQLAPDGRGALRQILRGRSWHTQGEQGNARAIRNLVERSLRCQALRLVGEREPTREQLMTITRADLEDAVRVERLESSRLAPPGAI
ncbi:MAG: AAA family ATPase [Bacillota bacterium]